MKLSRITILVVCVVPMAAVAADFSVGDRVHVGSVNQDGTVVAVGQRMGDGGTNIKVHIDGAPYPADVGILYDSAMSRVTVIGHGAAAAGAVRTPNQVLPDDAAADSRPPGKVAPGTANCQQAIRANYIATGGDQRVSVKFLSFQITGSGPYESIYKDDQAPGARGHVVQALSIHAKYQVLTHYADANADDELRTYDANFKCYNTPANGELMTEMTDRLDGGEHATYIHKQ